MDPIVFSPNTAEARRGALHLKGQGGDIVKKADSQGKGLLVEAIATLAAERAVRNALKNRGAPRVSENTSTVVAASRGPDATRKVPTTAIKLVLDRRGVPPEMTNSALAQASNPARKPRIDTPAERRAVERAHAPGGPGGRRISPAEAARLAALPTGDVGGEAGYEDGNVEIAAGDMGGIAGVLSAATPSLIPIAVEALAKTISMVAPLVSEAMQGDGGSGDFYSSYHVDHSTGGDVTKLITGTIGDDGDVSIRSTGLLDAAADRHVGALYDSIQRANGRIEEALNTGDVASIAQLAPSVSKALDYLANPSKIAKGLASSLGISAASSADANTADASRSLNAYLHQLGISDMVVVQSNKVTSTSPVSDAINNAAVHSHAGILDTILIRSPGSAEQFLNYLTNAGGLNIPIGVRLQILSDGIGAEQNMPTWAEVNEAIIVPAPAAGSSTAVRGTLRIRMSDLVSRMGAKSFATLNAQQNFLIHPLYSDTASPPGGVVRTNPGVNFSKFMQRNTGVLVQDIVPQACPIAQIRVPSIIPSAGIATDNWVQIPQPFVLSGAEPGYTDYLLLTVDFGWITNTAGTVTMTVVSEPVAINFYPEEDAKVLWTGQGLGASRVIVAAQLTAIGSALMRNSVQKANSTQSSGLQFRQA